MAIKRIRDKLRTFKPQEVISYETWVDIEDRAAQAEEFMKEGNFLSSMLESELKEAEEIVLTNRVHKVKEVRLLGDIQKIFTTEKKVQLDELVGQIKFIRGFLAEARGWIQRKAELESLESNGKVIIRRSPEEEVLNERPRA